MASFSLVEPIMIVAGDVTSTLGIMLFLVGVGYWIWFFRQSSRITVMRRQSRWDLLGNLTVVGLSVFALGRALAEGLEKAGRGRDLGLMGKISPGLQAPTQEAPFMLHGFRPEPDFPSNKSTNQQPETCLVRDRQCDWI